MARVNVEQKAFVDDRFVRLGAAIGADRWAAIGRMTLVWNTCQERENHTLSRETINAIHNDISDLTSLLVQCELARPSRGGFYIAGAKERCGWLGKARKNGKLGGRPKKNQTDTPKKPSGSAGKNPPAPALTPAPTGSTSPSETKGKESAEQMVESFVVTAGLRAEAAQKYPGVDIDAETDLWRDRLRANGYRTNAGPVKNATAAWRYWMGNAQKRAGGKRTPLQQTITRIRKDD